MSLFVLSFIADSNRLIYRQVIDSCRVLLEVWALSQCVSDIIISIHPCAKM